MKYTVAMRERDAEIDKMLLTPREPRECWCTGACNPANESYEGACVCIPHYHQAYENERALLKISIALSERQRLDPEPAPPLHEDHFQGRSK